MACYSAAEYPAEIAPSAPGQDALRRLGWQRTQPGATTMSMSPYPPISLWMDQLDQPLTPRPALQGRLEVDVAIIGAGYTGLWTAYYLKGEARLLAGLPAEQRRAAFDLLHGIPDAVAEVLQREGIACDYRQGGVLYCAARYPEQERRLRSWLDSLYAEGLSEAHYRL